MESDMDCCHSYSCTFNSLGSRRRLANLKSKFDAQVFAEMKSMALILI
jgi:hypothetical protein